MAIAYRSSALVASGTRTTTTVSMPAGVQANDIVLVLCTAGATAAPTITPPASLSANLVANVTYSNTDPWSVVMRVYRYKVVGSGDPASFAFTHGSAASEAFAVAYSGVDQTTPIDATPTTNTVTDTVSSTNIETPIDLVGLTTSTVGVMLVGYRGSWDGEAITPPSGWTERLDQPVTWVGEFLQATAGATGNTPVDAGNAFTGGSYPSPAGTILVPLRPAGGGGGTSYTSNPSDTLGITDNVSAVLTGTNIVSKSDTLGITDTVVVAQIRNITIADSLSITDTGSPQAIDIGITIADSVGITDTTATTAAMSRLIADSLAITDTLANSASISGSISGQAPSLTSSVSGSVSITGAATATLSAATSSISGSTSATGSVNVAAPAITGSVTGLVRVSGSVAAATSQLSVNVAGAIKVSGGVAAALPIITGVITSSNLVAGTIAASPPRITGSISGSMLVTGGVSSALSAATGATIGTVRVFGSIIDNTIPELSTTISGSVVIAGLIAQSEVPLVVASLSAVIDTGEQVPTPKLGDTDTVLLAGTAEVQRIYLGSSVIYDASS